MEKVEKSMEQKTGDDIMNHRWTIRNSNGMILIQNEKQEVKKQNKTENGRKI